MTGGHRGTECHLVHHKSHLDCLEMESSLRRQMTRTMALSLTATGHVFVFDGSTVARCGRKSEVPPQLFVMSHFPNVNITLAAIYIIQRKVHLCNWTVCCNTHVTAGTGGGQVSAKITHKIFFDPLSSH